MKKILNTFKKTVLNEAELSDYNTDGNVAIYHYSRADADNLTIDPKYFSDKAKRSSYTRNEYEISSVPRTFFYVDPKQREIQVASGAKLYGSSIPLSRIYDLRKDPQGYVQKIRHPIYGLRKGIEWNELLESIREDYDGVFYGGSFDVVSLFKPHDAARIPDEERAQLEGNVALKLQLGGN